MPAPKPTPLTLKLARVLTGLGVLTSSLRFMSGFGYTSEKCYPSPILGNLISLKAAIYYSGAFTGVALFSLAMPVTLANRLIYVI